ncbi:MAG TPA: nucleoside monophosphate kinase, partial [Gammaproteobacteria bacterium]
GQLVPNDIVLGMIRERLQNPDARNGFILDGFPRNIEQAEALDDLLDGMGKPIESALLIDVDFESLMQRLTGRLTCESCGAVYNRFSKPPVIDDECDKCGGKLHHRSDDNEDTIGKRLRVYESQTQPLIDFYRQQNKLSTVTGKGDINDIFNKIVSVLKSASLKKPAVAAKPKPAPAKVEAPAKPVVTKTIMQKPESKPPVVVAPAPAPAPTPAKPAVAKPKAAAPAKPKVAAPAAAKPAAAKKAAVKKAAKPATKKKAPARAKTAKKATARVPGGSVENMRKSLASMQAELKDVSAKLKEAEARGKALMAQFASKPAKPAKKKTAKKKARAKAKKKK